MKPDYAAAATELLKEGVSKKYYAFSIYVGGKKKFA